MVSLSRFLHPVAATASSVLVALASVAVISLSACGKKNEAPKTAAQVQADKAANDKAVRSNAISAAPMAGLDKAKEVQGIVDKQAADANKKIEGDAK